MLEVGLEDGQADPEQLHQDVHLVVLGRLRGVEKETQIITKVILTYRLMVRHIMHLTSGGISNLITVIFFKKYGPTPASFVYFSL